MTGAVPLFRQEAVRYRSDRLHGVVSIAAPLRWQVIGYLLFAMVISTLLFLLSSSYARIETVKGEVALDRGVAKIMPSRAGTISRMAIHEGRPVRRGDILVTIRSDEDAVRGATATQRIRDALSEQYESLTNQVVELEGAARADRARLAEQIVGLKDEIAILANQIDSQRSLLNTSVQEVAAVRTVSDRGFISKRDLEAREAVAIQRRQQLLELQRQRMSRLSAIAEAQRSIAQIDATAQAQIATSQTNRAELEERRAQADLAQGYSITAPVSGVVTGMTAKIGQRVMPDEALLMIVPANARTRVELLVPSAAIGFVKRRQAVRLAVDAFPFERFGTISARISDIASAATLSQTPAGPVPVYLVIADLDRPYVRAYGQNERLRPGMTLTARIVTERRSLLEWLFEPIFAVRNR